MLPTIAKFPTFKILIFLFIKWYKAANRKNSIKDSLQKVLQASFVPQLSATRA
jgi:hypothetical protein